MNNNRRQVLTKALFYINSAQDLFEQVRDEEQDSLDNFPESFQLTERYEKMEANIDMLDNIIDLSEEIKENINSITE